MTPEPVPDWQLREATQDDCRALALIGAATFLDSFAGVLEGAAIVAHCEREHSHAAYEAYLAHGARAWLAEAGNGGAPVGFAMTAAPDIPGARGGDIELKRIYALSRFHGTGLAAAMLEQIIGAHADCQRVILGVYENNARALRFYAKHGFEAVATRQFNVGGNLYDDVVLARPMHSLERQF